MILARRNFSAALLIPISIGLACLYMLVSLRSSFAWYDDEGFMLMTLREYIGGLPLYEGMYTEYGPFYYVFHQALFRMAGWIVSHDHIRQLSIAFWFSIALGWASCVWIWRRSLLMAGAAFFATVVALRVLSSEPGHPQSLILVLFTLLFLTVNGYRRVPNPIVFMVLGGVSAAMALTKINLGLFACASLAAVFSACLPRNGFTNRIWMMVRLSCAALPALLMYGQLNEPLMILQCAIFTFGIWAVLTAIRDSAKPELPWSAAAWGAFGFLAVAFVTILSVNRHGTSFAGILDGVVLQPLRFSHDIPYLEKRLRVLSAALYTLFTAGFWFYARRHGGTPVSRSLRFAVAFGIIALTIIRGSLSSALAPGIMWVLVPSSASGSGPTRQVPVFVVVAAATIGILMTFPVAGTQTSIAAVVVLLAAFATLTSEGNDAPTETNALAKAQITRQEKITWSAILSVALITGCVTASVDLLSPSGDDYLPNSRLIRLPADKFTVFSQVTSGISAHCDTLVTIPGMNSFHIWSGLPHPTGFVVSSAMVSFDSVAQDQLRKAFFDSARPCVVYNPDLERWSARYRPVRSNQPFIDLVRDELVPVYSRAGYEIRVPPNQVAAWH